MQIRMMDTGTKKQQIPEFSTKATNYLRAFLSWISCLRSTCFLWRIRIILSSSLTPPPWPMLSCWGHSAGLFGNRLPGSISCTRETQSESTMPMQTQTILISWWWSTASQMYPDLSSVSVEEYDNWSYSSTLGTGKQDRTMFAMTISILQHAQIQANTINVGAHVVYPSGLGDEEPHKMKLWIPALFYQEAYFYLARQGI